MEVKNNIRVYMQLARIHKPSTTAFKNANMKAAAVLLIASVLLVSVQGNPLDVLDQSNSRCSLPWLLKQAEVLIKGIFGALTKNDIIRDLRHLVVDCSEKSPTCLEDLLHTLPEIKTALVDIIHLVKNTVNAVHRNCIN